MQYFKLLSVILGIIVLSLFLIIAYTIYKNFKTDTINQAILRTEKVSILFSFEFEDSSHQNSIISFILMYSPKTRKTVIFEITSNLGVFDSEKDTVFPLAYYYYNFGYERYIEIIKNLSHNDDLSYFFVSSSSLEKFIDIVGGIEIPVIGDLLSLETNNGIDGFSSLYTIIDKKALIDGLDIASFLSDIEKRILIQTKNDYVLSSRRMSFITALIETLKDQKDSINNTVIMKNLFSLVHTNLSMDNLQSVFLLPQNFEEEKTYFQILQGDIDTVTIGNKNYPILFIDNSIGSIFSLLQDFVDKEIRSNLQDPISLTILNGTVLNGLAGATKEMYEKNRIFSILGVGNATSSDIRYSVVLDRTGNKRKAMKVAELAGIKSILTDIAVLDDMGAEVTLILGEDFDGEAISE